MNGTLPDLERRLRDALYAEAARARPELIRPVSLDLAARADRPSMRSRRLRLMAPIAASCAVLALIAGIALAGRPDAIRPAVSAGSGVPGYYVALVTSASPYTLTVQVRSSQTGKLLTSTRMDSAFGFGPSITTADGRSFDVAAPATLHGKDVTRLLSLRVGNGGHSVRLTALPIQPLSFGQVVSGLALSADGTKLAIMAFHFNYARDEFGTAQLTVVSPASGQQLGAWTTSAAGMASQPSWLAGGKLAFSWAAASAHPSGQDKPGVRLLDTAAAGGSLLSARLLVPAQIAAGTIESALVSPDGHELLATVVSKKPSAGTSGTLTGRVVRLSAAGHVLQVLHSASARYTTQVQQSQLSQACEVMSADPSRQNVLMTCWQFGRLAAGIFRHLPGSVAISAAW
jgi:hypothetical protein